MDASPSGSESALIESFSIIPDPHERLSAIVASCSGPGIPETDRRDEDLVPGCVSRVWIAGRMENGCLRLQWDADSPLVRGLAGLICRVYDGSPTPAAAAHPTAILAGLQLDRQLSPTRLNGLTNAAARIREIARILR